MRKIYGFQTINGARMIQTISYELQARIQGMLASIPVQPRPGQSETMIEKREQE